MAEIILIPGYATEFTSSLRDARGHDGGFRAFAADVKTGRATVYRWGIKEHVSFLRHLDFFYLLNLYRRERVLASSRTTLEELERRLQIEQPRQIVCHSMGCFLFSEYLKMFSLPASVEKVIFVQADLSYNVSIETNIMLQNLFCPWDPTLWVSVFVHRRLPAGLIGLKGEKNQLFPLWKLPNLHVSSICDQRLLKRVNRF